MNLSVVCPFYNEEAILENALKGMVAALEKLELEWELLIVNDGSLDASPLIASAFCERHPQVRLISYPVNRGRGYALRSGIEAAKGEIIVTTEADLSWGETVVEELYQALASHPKMDFVIASPNLPEGGYRNVPPKRIWVSRLGNKILRVFFSFRFTMHTGMTRAYRKDVIQPLDFRENGKEFHLESLLKLTALDHKGMEVPAILEWKDDKLAKTNAPKRKSSSKIPQLILSHLRFAILANPVRYFWAIAILCALIGVICFGVGAVRFLMGEVSIYFLLLSILMGQTAVIFFGFGIITAQNRILMEELWLHKKRNVRSEPAEKP